ncbi:MAG TPA: SDR family oxidoreductase [Ilumatobacteraceae bacterium]|nr:SDR family oxidoreductase [Ilumatobacteraceae bacterium]
MTKTANQISLAGTVSIITGAAQGIGEGIARTFSVAGAKVALIDRQGDKVQAVADSLDGDVHVGVFDVRDPEAVAVFCAEVGQKWGTVHSLVNNAGGVFVANFMDVSAKGEAALIAENFTQVTSMIRNTVPLMTEGGSIINITSVEAFRAAPGFSIYGAMKAAVEHLTRTLALELSPSIRVNSISPDAIPTAGDEGLAASFGAGHYDNYVNGLALGIGSPADLADCALFLASDLSRYLTGDSLHVDGGSYAASGWSRDAEGIFRP